MTETTAANPFYKSEKGQQAMTKWYDSLVDKFEVEAESLYVPTRFGQTHMFAAGPKDAPPLILVQGLSASAPLWRHQLRDLSRSLRVYALDTPGQPGRSDPNPPSYLDQSYSHWLEDVVDGLGLEKASFGGISAGAWLSFQFGLFAPQRVHKVVLTSMSGLRRGKLPVKIWLNNWVRKPKETDALADSLTAKSYSPKSKGKTYDQQIARAMALATKHYRVDLSLRIHNEKTNRINFLTGMKVLRKFFWPMPDAELRAMSRPALLILGEQETMFDSAAAVKRVERLVPNVEAHIIKGVGHTVVYDRPEEVNGLIEAFLLRD